jgi:hypothetical protein
MHLQDGTADWNKTTPSIFAVGSQFTGVRLFPAEWSSNMTGFKAQKSCAGRRHCDPPPFMLASKGRADRHSSTRDRKPGLSQFKRR